MSPIDHGRLSPKAIPQPPGACLRLPVNGPVALSHECRGRKPSDRLFRLCLEKMPDGIVPSEVLHIGSRILQDIVPARRMGMKTALFAGDKTSLQATAEQLEGATSRPDVMLTELAQITHVVG